MTIHETLKQSIPDALREKDDVRLRTLRSLVAAMVNELVAKRRKPTEFLTDEEAISVLKRAANQRKDSITQFENASREDLAGPEKAELVIINTYLPAMMTREEIQTHVAAKMNELGEAIKIDANKLVGIVMKELKGRADGNDVKVVVDNLTTCFHK
ncbi:hypothetical protein A3G63_01845 [Candidatus Kaiserbacteria bacterium RIFCSPLOWO2_12_FULL_52_8]|uniref:Glutamyl-tRNA amidotransferase n=1 Tax=Candidatus Kaiserbacteria bacterium RIFCSPHIGHO2_01_FULL_53_31 TaxID=1798481 RepID=A0A1F6CJX2_9BACT|nr:MAG: hypothetical protein A2678_00060 [Candidatus Kaiserbacteria bacterium RIFCSPHIGHO2_01_FULL_53_31]OGG93199.1 MAG: hypothetical protein A3G63_01845 [Candidatus Kaiserbacteria bacterium RIFCSPLOWO2_12_FULL_52_8]